MSKIYDDWERLVTATLDRVKFRELALASSRETSFSSSVSARFNSTFNFKFRSLDRGDSSVGDSYFDTALELVDQVPGVFDTFEPECLEIKSKVEEVSSLLHEAVRVSINAQLYDRPARHVVAMTATVLGKAISLMLKCGGSPTEEAVSAASLQDILFHLDHAIANLSWLLRDDQYLGVPPIAADEPILCNIWELIAVLHTGSIEDQCAAVGYLLSLARESEVHRQLIIKEGGWNQPLLRLLHEGTPEMQEDAATIITLLGMEDPRVIDATVSSVFQEILLKQDASSKLQGIVAQAIPNTRFNSPLIIFQSISTEYRVQKILATPIELIDQVIEAADEVVIFKQECTGLKSKARQLAALLLQVARASKDIYEHPARRIIHDADQVLQKVLALVSKCRANGIMKRVFTIIPDTAFPEMSSSLENSIRNVSWLLHISTSADKRTDDYPGLPPMALNHPILCLIWEHIAILYTGSANDRTDAAASLVSLARDNDRYRKLIVQEGGVRWLLKLLKEGKLEGQKNAARAIGLLGKDPESVEHMISAGICSIFARILKEAPMKVQSVVAWAVSELAVHYPKCQDLFAFHNTVRFLVSHLAFETVQEHKLYTVVTSTMAIKGIVNRKAREQEDFITKAHMKAMSARALWHLAKGNSPVCRSITESRALLCFAFLLENGPEEVQFNSAMAVMEITAVAEGDVKLRRSAFKPNSPACKAVVDQLFKIVDNADSDLLIPCIKAIGNLARTFKATETRMIIPLARLLEHRDAEVTNEACIALTKFASTDNYLHLDHSKAITAAEGVKHLVQLVLFGEQTAVKKSALILLCYLTMHLPDSESLGKAEVLTVLEWGMKQGPLMQVEEVAELLAKARGILALYEPSGSQGFL